MQRPKLDFMNMKPPPGYVAGIGRGAAGFTTRSDIGPGKDPMEMAAEAEKQRVIAMGKAGAEEKAEAKKKTGSDDEEYDEEYGYAGSLFADQKWDDDDDEADRVYNAIDNRMDEKRKEKREAKEKEEMDKFRKERPKLQTQFADVKSRLSEVSADEWLNIPEANDMSSKRQKTQKRADRITAMNASMIASNVGMSGLSTSIDTKGGLTTPFGNGAMSTVGGTESSMTDLTQIGRARNSMLNVELEKASDSVTGQTVIDPKGYLTDLNSMTSIKSATEVGDIKKARLLLKRLIGTNPKHPPGWIAAARLEEVAGKMLQARKLVMEGTEQCPHSEDLWLEASRLMPPEDAKAVVSEGLQKIPLSVKLWVKAMEMESELKGKKRVIRKALEALPNSVRLWKAAVEMEEPENAVVLLSRAVECCPQSVELWLALAHLENYENARKVLNKAREAVPTEKLIWITAAKLEEANDNVAMCDKIIQRAVKVLAANGVEINRDAWIKSAEECEQSESIHTAKAIIMAVIGLGVDDQDRKHTWKEDAASCTKNSAPECARAIHAHAVSVLPSKKSVWIDAAYHELNTGTRDSLQQLLQKAVRYCPKAEVLWLMGAKQQWLAGDLDGARRILQEAFKANSDSESIYLAAVKLESENDFVEHARILLTKARKLADTPKVWTKSAMLEWQQGQLNDALAILETATEKFPDYSKLWMVKGQVNVDLGQIETARSTYTKALQYCPYSIPLWLLLVRLERAQNIDTRARALLEKARLKNPGIPELWLEAVRMEWDANRPEQALSVMAKGLQECPKSALLWSESVFLEPRPKRRVKSVDGIKATNGAALAVLACARLFWADRKFGKAREWFNRTLKSQTDIGDVWAMYYKFEKQHGTPQQLQDVVKRCIAAEPKYGELWAPTAKNVKNYKLKTKDILLLVVEQLDEKLVI